MPRAATMLLERGDWPWGWPANEQGLSTKGRGDTEKEKGNKLKSRTVGIMSNWSPAESVLLNSWSLNWALFRVHGTSWVLVGTPGTQPDSGSVCELAPRASQADPRHPMDGNLACGSPRDCLDLMQIWEDTEVLSLQDMLHNKHNRTTPLVSSIHPAGSEKSHVFLHQWL